MNSTKESSVPYRRFKDFKNVGTWEQHKLGELMEITSVKRIHQNEWRSQGVRFLRARDVVAAFKHESVTDKIFIDKEIYEKYSKISGKPSTDDLLVTGVGSIGVPLLIKSNTPVYFKDGNIIWFKNNMLDGNYFYYSFISRSIQSYIKKTSGSGTVGTYTISSAKSTPIWIPNFEEQRKVGLLFASIDHLITLHQHKLDRLEKLKSAYLTEVFPAEGEYKLKRRFVFCEKYNE